MAHDSEPEEMVLSEHETAFAMYVAMAVRNAMESFHHDHLSDEQMAELNPIIRNAIATAYYASRHPEHPRCASFVNFQNRLLPDYWEPPEITSDLRGSQGTLPSVGHAVRRALGPH